MRLAGGYPPSCQTTPLSRSEATNGDECRSLPCEFLTAYSQVYAPKSTLHTATNDGDLHRTTTACGSCRHGQYCFSLEQRFCASSRGACQPCFAGPPTPHSTSWPGQPRAQRGPRAPAIGAGMGPHTFVSDAGPGLCGRPETQISRGRSQALARGRSPQE